MSNEVTKELIEKSKNFYYAMRDGLIKGNFEECDEALINDEEDLDVNFMSSTFLRWGIKMKDSNIVKYLMSKDAIIPNDLDNSAIKEMILLSPKEMIELNPIEMVEIIKAEDGQEFKDIYNKIQTGEYL